MIVMNNLIKMTPFELFLKKETAQTQEHLSQYIPTPTAADMPTSANTPPVSIEEVKTQPTTQISVTQRQTAQETLMHMQVNPQAIAPTSAPKALYYLCTVTDASYLFKVVAQYHSLKMYARDFYLYVCCTDEQSYRTLKSLKMARCIPVTLKDLNYGELFTLQKQRAANEFAWTLKSYLMLYLLEVQGLPHVLYCDGDVSFAGDAGHLYADWGPSSIYLCLQRDVDWVEKKYGTYQAGIMGVRNDANGLSMLRWWRDKCREWCFNYEDNGRLGDQKYLDDVPSLFGSVKISSHRGINAAPWNTIYNNGYKITAKGSQVTIDGDPLVAYHFACIDIYDETRFDLWRLGKIDIQPIVLNAIYIPYLKALQAAIVLIKTQIANISQLFFGKSFDTAKTPYLFTEANLRLSQWDGKYAFCTIASRTYVVKTLAFYSSIRRYLSDFHLWICCVDDTAYTVLSRFELKNTTLLPIRSVETPEILQTRNSKSTAEYCWTLKPALCEYIFTHYNVNRLLYCDSDIYFFSHPKAVYDVWTNYATMLNLQLGSAELEHKHGMHQAGMIGFSKEPDSLEILRWWKQKCTEWCYDDHSDPSRWGDQKYLQQIPNQFVNIKVNDRYGIVAAPWNIVMNNIHDLRVSRAGGDVYIGNEKLTAYHFGSINVIDERTFDLWKLERLSFDRRILDYIYMPYLTQIQRIFGAIRANGISLAPLFAEEKSSFNLYQLHPLKENAHGNSGSFVW